MPQAEIVLDALTAAVDEIDQDIVRVLQRAVNAILEACGPAWLDDAWFAVTMGGFRGVMRMVGVLYPTTRNVFWQTVATHKDAIRAMQAGHVPQRSDGPAARRTLNLFPNTSGVLSPRLDLGPGDSRLPTPEPRKPQNAWD